MGGRLCGKFLRIVKSSRIRFFYEKVRKGLKGDNLEFLDPGEIWFLDKCKEKGVEPERLL